MWDGAGCVFWEGWGVRTKTWRRASDWPIARQPKALATATVGKEGSRCRRARPFAPPQKSGHAPKKNPPRNKNEEDWRAVLR